MKIDQLRVERVTRLSLAGWAGPGFLAVPKASLDGALGHPGVVEGVLPWQGIGCDDLLRSRSNHSVMFRNGKEGTVLDTPNCAEKAKTESHKESFVRQPHGWRIFGVFSWFCVHVCANVTELI